MGFPTFRGIRGLFSNAVQQTFLNQFWRIVSGPLLLLLIPLFLTQESQGFWYTFISISALSIFADLGFSTIVCQFAAHEFAFLSFDKRYRILGPENCKQNLYSLLLFVMKWSILISMAAFPVIFAIGYVMFAKKATIEVWLVPWVLYSVGSLLAFLNGVVASFIQGCDQVEHVQRASLISAVAYSLVIILGLVLHMGLYALSFAILVCNLVYAFLLLSTYREFIIGIQQVGRGAKKWTGDIVMLLWKYAISFSSGYFVFQLYTPFMFQFHGPADAGKVGITVSLISAVFSIANSWFYSALPKINMLVAKKEWSALDKEFRKDMILSSVTYLLGIGVLFSLILLFSGKWDFFDKVESRFLGVVPLVMLSVCWLFQMFQNGMAIYLRAHRQEPFLAPSLVNGLFVLATTYLSARFLPSSFLFLGFLMSFCYSLPWCIAIFSKKKQEWHLESVIYPTRA